MFMFAILAIIVLSAKVDGKIIMLNTGMADGLRSKKGQIKLRLITKKQIAILLCTYVLILKSCPLVETFYYKLH